MTGPTWTDEQDAMLRDCIKEGLTARQVAQRINGTFKTDRSRNAIIGRAQRLKLNFSGHDLTPVAAAKHADNVTMMRAAGGRRGTAKRVASKTPLPGRPKARPDPTTMPELEPLGPLNEFPPDSAAQPQFCRAIKGDPLFEDWRCCARPVVGNGRPYCENHQVKFYNPKGDAGRAPHWLIPRGAAGKLFG